MSCLRYHALGNVKQLNDKYRTKFYEQYITLEGTLSFDDEYYVCGCCHRALKTGRIPTLNAVRHDMSVPDLPDDFKTDEMQLNNCEAHLLKLVIPFIRIGHCDKSSELKMFGQVIQVEADVGDTMEKILPISQELIPVALKRLPHHKSYFIKPQIVSKTKLMKYFKYFKDNNHLYKDIEFSDVKFQELIDSITDDIRRQHEWKDNQAANPDPTETVNTGDDLSDLEDDMSEQVDSSVIDKDKNLSKDEDSFKEDKKHDLPSYLTETPADTIIDPVNLTPNKQTLSDILATAIIRAEQKSTNLKKRKAKSSDKMEMIDLAPTVDGEFRDFEKFDEKCQIPRRKSFPTFILYR